MPQKLSLLENVDSKQAIAEIITNPNKNWKKLRGKGTWQGNPTFKP
jgi:hypothetical protein